MKKFYAIAALLMAALYYFMFMCDHTPDDMYLANFPNATVEQLESKSELYGKMTTKGYYMYLKSDSYNNFRVKVSKDLYQSISIGDKVSMVYNTGNGEVYKVEVDK